MSDDKLTFYGIWIPNEGWLKGKDFFADSNLEKVQEVAKMIGKGARVLYIDPSITDLEKLYLEHERKSLWHSLMSLLKRKMNK